MLDNQQIVEALKRVAYPGYSRDIVSFGFVRAVETSEQGLLVEMQLPGPNPDVERQLEEAVRREVGSLPGAGSVEVRFLAAPQEPATSPGAQAPARQVEGISHLIAVASGKGGVGKSTVAVNVAVALARQGLAVGLLDSDIYGPSIPLMMGIREQPEARNNRMVPLENHGVRTMSIGYLLEDDAPVIWRGPMVMKALTQFLREVEWGTLDYLVLDLPPGTGDAQLTLVQSVPLAGAVAVTTPQDVALIDAKKAVSMFRKTGVPVLGIVENMSAYLCPSCGHREPIFGEGGGRREADRAGVPLLGEIPINSRIREGGDRGVPVVADDPDSPVAEAFEKVATAIREAVEKQS
jgi:ATP-binding protein involved in chromosome partitioning